MFKIDWDQQGILDKFFKEEISWFANNVLDKFIAAFFIGVSLILLCFPYEALKGESKSVIITMNSFYLYGIFFIQNKYATYTETGKTRKTIYELVKYLPVTKVQLCFFRIRKIFKVCLGVTLFVVAVKVVTSMALYGSFSVFDVIIPVLMQLILPIGLNLLCVF